MHLVRDGSAISNQVRESHRATIARHALGGIVMAAKQRQELVGRGWWLLESTRRADGSTKEAKLRGITR